MDQASFFTHLNYDVRLMIYEYIDFPPIKLDWAGFALSCRQAFLETSKIAHPRAVKFIRTTNAKINKDLPHYYQNDHFVQIRSIHPPPPAGSFIFATKFHLIFDVSAKFIFAPPLPMNSHSNSWIVEQVGFYFFKTAFTKITIYVRADKTFPRYFRDILNVMNRTMDYVEGYAFENYINPMVGRAQRSVVLAWNLLPAPARCSPDTELKGTLACFDQVAREDWVRTTFPGKKYRREDIYPWASGYMVSGCADCVGEIGVELGDTGVPHAPFVMRTLRPNSCVNVVTWSFQTKFTMLVGDSIVGEATGYRF